VVALCEPQALARCYCWLGYCFAFAYETLSVILISGRPGGEVGRKGGVRMGQEERESRRSG